MAWNLARDGFLPHPIGMMKNSTPFGRFRPRFLAPVLLTFFLPGCGGDAPDGAATQPPPNPLLEPANFQETGPESYRVRMQTTKGEVVIQVNREWSPHGADRFYNLVKAGYYDGVRIHRVVPGFVAEFGVHAVPHVNVRWRKAYIVDDTVRVPNNRGRVTFAKGAPHSRTVQVFINLRDNPSLDTEWFAPFGEVVEGMEVVDSFYGGYGDGPPRGRGPYLQMAIAAGGGYFDEEFPLLDTIEKAVIESSGGG
ncbi:peptidylprolyl isomerase [Gemmatimonadota bacterium]